MRFSWVAAAAACAVSVPASAATYLVNLSVAPNADSSEQQIVPISLAEGDSVELVLASTTGQPLRYDFSNNPPGYFSFIYAGFMSSPTVSLFRISYEFKDLIGDSFRPSGATEGLYYDGFYHIAGFVYEFSPAGEIVFSSLRQTFTLLRADGPLPTFTGTFFLTNASVPEPTTWALLIGGVAAIGAVMRRSRANVSVRYA